jgi:hypothetical protein
MAARSVPGIRQMDEVACIVGEDNSFSLGGRMQLKLIGLAKMTRVSCCQAVNAMLGQNRGQGDRYRFIQIEFHGMVGVAG